MVLMDGIRIGEISAKNQKFLVREVSVVDQLWYGQRFQALVVSLVFVEGRMNSNSYLTMLEANLVPFLQKYWRLKFIFQQDNASIHVSSASKQWFTAKKIDLLDWPAKSPDLNIIENVWSLLAKDVYDNSRQFDNISNLKRLLRRLGVDLV